MYICEPLLYFIFTPQSLHTHTFSYISNLHDVWKLLKCKTDNLFYEYEPSEETGERRALLIFVPFIFFWREVLPKNVVNLNGFGKTNQDPRKRQVYPTSKFRTRHAECRLSKVHKVYSYLSTKRPLYGKSNIIKRFSTKQVDSLRDIRLNSYPIQINTNFNMASPSSHLSHLISIPSALSSLWAQTRTDSTSAINQTLNASSPLQVNPLFRIHTSRLTLRKVTDVVIKS